MKRLALAAALLLHAAPALAWANQGHMATGAVAYDTLVRADPAAAAAVVALMAAHPDRARFERNLAGVTGPARDRLMFEYMARWPDDIRETPWDHPKWHYALRIVSGATAIPLIFGQAAEAFDRNLAIARDAEAKPADRAVALCWVFHITGDMHEPIHAGHRLSWRFFFTDRSGTIAWVRRFAADQPMGLHRFWDTSPQTQNAELGGAADIARRAEARVPLRPDRATAFPAWVDESRALAARYVYKDGALGAAREPEHASLLSPGYRTEARAISERRIGQAGVRLAGLLEPPR